MKSNYLAKQFYLRKQEFLCKKEKKLRTIKDTEKIKGNYTYAFYTEQGIFQVFHACNFAFQKC